LAITYSSKILLDKKTLKENTSLFYKDTYAMGLKKLRLQTTPYEAAVNKTGAWLLDKNIQRRI
jgi:hypothetical protein